MKKLLTVLFVSILLLSGCAKTKKSLSFSDFEKALKNNNIEFEKIEDEKENVEMTKTMFAANDISVYILKEYSKSPIMLVDYNFEKNNKFDKEYLDMAEKIIKEAQEKGTFTLPFQIAMETSPLTYKVDYNKKMILIIDDEMKNRDVLIEIFKKL